MKLSSKIYPNRSGAWTPSCDLRFKICSRQNVALIEPIDTFKFRSNPTVDNSEIEVGNGWIKLGFGESGEEDER